MDPMTLAIMSVVFSGIAAFVAIVGIIAKGVEVWWNRPSKLLKRQLKVDFALPYKIYRDAKTKWILREKIPDIGIEKTFGLSFHITNRSHNEFRIHSIGYTLKGGHGPFWLMSQVSTVGTSLFDTDPIPYPISIPPGGVYNQHGLLIADDWYPAGQTMPTAIDKICLETTLGVCWYGSEVTDVRRVSEAISVKDHSGRFIYNTLYKRDDA